MYIRVLVLTLIPLWLGIEFDEAFRVFSNDKDEMSTATSTLIPFLK